jgi:hypothetical protein
MNAYKDMLDNVVSHITCVSMNHLNQLEQMANGAMFATAISLATRGLTAAVGFLPVLLLRLGDSLMNGWMWRPAEAEAINRQAPRAKGGAEPGLEWAEPVGLGRSAQAHFGLVRPRFPP